MQLLLVSNFTKHTLCSIISPSSFPSSPASSSTHTHTHWRVRKNRDGSIRWVNQSALSNNCSLYFYYDQCNFSSSSSSSSSICPSEFLIFHPFFQTPVCQFLCVPITTNNLLASVTNCCLELAFYSSIIVLFTCANANYKVQLNFPNKNHRPMWLLFFVSIRRTTRYCYVPHEP